MTIEARLTKKNILVLSVEYFGYERAIVQKLRTFGAHVDFYDERPSNSVLAKGIIRVKRSLYQKNIDAYYRKILRQILSTHYDYLLVLRGEVVPAFFLQAFRKMNPHAHFVYYTWDSFKNNKHSLNILKYFDAQYTFDPDDAYNYKIKFRPLFFMDEYGRLNRPELNGHLYDLLFLGTAHSDRYSISNKLIEWCHKKELRTYAYYYCQSRSVFFYKKLFDPLFKTFEYRSLSFQPLSRASVLRLYRQSSVILDINHPDQGGLTIRTFEALGAGKKIITTNSEIKKYPFYDENNILIIDRDDPKLSLEFFKTPFRPLDRNVLYTMSLSGWVNEIL